MPHLPWNIVYEHAVKFAKDPVHKEARSESAEKQTFWNDFFEVFGLRRASLASFEENVRNLKGNQGAIDLLWRGKLLVEHKSRGENLGYAQTQAFTYIEDLTRAGRWEDLPRYVLVSDFARFVLYDLEPEQQRDLPIFEVRTVEQVEFSLEDFPRHIKQFAFMFGPARTIKAEDPANEKAYDRMCELHDRLKANGFIGHDLERLLVRILFCMFAEDTLIFQPDVFTQFIRDHTREDGSDLGAKLNELFDWLNQSAADGLLEETDQFYGFRWVNGGLFKDRLGFPRFNREAREALLYCCEFLWERISPAVFGSLFQGVLDNKTRRQQGAHYTNERDIMKVIRSLFLDELRAEWSRRQSDKSTRKRTEMEAFHERLRSLRFLDPACGCGNFLVLAYRELRLLETEVVTALYVRWFGDEERHAQQTFRSEEFSKLVGVNVDQFYGIEYSEWPVRIAEVALWLMDHQMNQQGSEAFGQSIDRLPLRASPHIVQGNALRLDWNDMLPRVQCSYVLGNPPFVGKKEQNTLQKADMARVWGTEKGTGVLDYVTAWYVKAAEYIQRTEIQVAFVSTNSISQGEQVGVLWRGLRRRFVLHINFAHRSFAWMSEARGKAHVHVVIIGFGVSERADKIIYDYPHSKADPTVSRATNINSYLADAADVLLFKRSKPLGVSPEINYGSMANDRRKEDKGLGNLILDRENRQAILEETPAMEPFIRPLIGSEEFLNGTERWCLWLIHASSALLKQSSLVLKRIEAVREARLSSGRPETIKLAETPRLFGEIRQPDSPYLLIPKVSSEERPRMPLGFLQPESIANGSSLIIPNATEYDFGVLSSMLHMAWMRYTGGRLESRYQYSSQIVYNNFPWPTPTAKQRMQVEKKARAVLAAREPHLPPKGMDTLANLYDPLTIPPKLAKAHAELDRAVEKCYRDEAFRSDSERVEYLFRLYEQLNVPLLPASPRTRNVRAKTSATPPRRRRGRTAGLPAASPAVASAEAPLTFPEENA